MFKIVHVSDLHLETGWEEAQLPVINAFFRDLEDRGLKKGRDILIFSGDLIAHGSSQEQVEEFKKRFSSEFDKHFTLDDRIFCPGNHEVDRRVVEDNLSILLPLARTTDDETSFNDSLAVGGLSSILASKFKNAFELALETFGCSLSEKSFTGHHFEMSSRCAVYVLNTAIFSFGGVTADGAKISDKELLRVETRKLRKWLDGNRDVFRILVMHHPLEWLVPWAKKAIDAVSRKHFDLVFTGHEHDPDVVENVRPRDKVIFVRAPALHSDERDTYLGYSVLSVVPNANLGIEYRQWSLKSEGFVIGSVMSGLEAGEAHFRLGTEKKELFTPPDVNVIRNVAHELKEEFEEALCAFKSIADDFIEPRLSRSPEYDEEVKPSDISPLDALAAANSSVVFMFAPQLFGLTTLGKYVALKWWEASEELLCYFELAGLPGYKSGIVNTVDKRLKELGLSSNYVKGFILDSAGDISKADARKIKALVETYPNAIIVVLQRLSASDRVSTALAEIADIKFDAFYLRSLAREHIRALVKADIEKGVEHDEDFVTQRVADDLEVLNIHRTPLHVKTLLAIAKRRIDVGPINRAEMLLQFMQIVFRNNVNLTYETLPDMKDSAYAIGYFCADLLRSETRYFSKREFIEKIEGYCKEKAVDLDIPVIFDILSRERLLVRTVDGFVFHYTYWLYFFAAQHMYANEEFRTWVIENCNYAKFPEVIEFYSAVDRHRRDLISTLSRQLATQRKAFEARSQIPITANLYDLLRWNVDKDGAKRLGESVAKFLEETALPTEIKDQIADESYDYTKPYSQELRTFIDKASLAQNMHIMVAAARALRNSDHVDKAEKLVLLREILFIWKQLLQSGLLVAKDIANSQTGLYEDVLFVAAWTEKMPPKEAFFDLIHGMPLTVGSAFCTDLTTKRMGPLFEAALVGEQDKLLQFFIAVQILICKPKDWVRILGNYIGESKSDSYYLSALNMALTKDYKRGFNSPENRDGLRTLIVRIVAKHQLNISNPNQKTTRDIETSLKDQLDKETK